MVIGNSQLNMESTRTYKSSSNAIAGVVTAASEIANQASREYSESQVVRKSVVSNAFAGIKNFKDTIKDTIEDNTEKAESQEKKQTKSQDEILGDAGLNLGRRRMRSLGIDRNIQERRVAWKIKQQTLLYLLLKIRRALTGEDLPEDILENESGNTAAPSGYNVENLNSNIIGQRFSFAEYNETEETSFNTTGTVITKDGRELNFDVSVSMSRKFAQAVSHVSDIVASSVNNLVDPLVINLDCNPASVSEQKFMFDLDADGKNENISMLNSSSGFLALDKNEDGIINDGSELFGTKSGNGFADLAKYDEDGNGWIDEADEIFSKLLIWTKDEDGHDKLYKLKELNVGAICLESVNTDFSLKNENNRTEGIIRQTGFFLYEDGTAGTVQHLDMAT